MDLYRSNAVQSSHMGLYKCVVVTVRRLCLYFDVLFVSGAVQAFPGGEEVCFPQPMTARR